MPNKNSWKASTGILTVSLETYLNVKFFLIHNIHNREVDIFLSSIYRKCRVNKSLLPLGKGGLEELNAILPTWKQILAASH